MKRSRVFVGWAILAAVAVLSGCVAEGPLPAAHVAVAADTPVYYEGYPVYYDGWGYPIFYVEGRVHYVPQTYPRYGYLTSRYRAAPYVAPYRYLRPRRG